MNTKLLICIAFSCLFLSACFLRKKPPYTFPKTFTKEQKDNFTKMCDKGRVLYDLNCAKCHNKTVKGKSVIPEFTVARLEAYKILFMNPEHQKNIAPNKMSMDELLDVTTFLTYRTKPKTSKKQVTTTQK